MNAHYVIPALPGVVSTMAVLIAVRLILLTHSVLNISGIILLLTMIFILFGFLYQLVTHDLSLVLFWQLIQILGISLMYPAWLIFIFLLTGNRKYICRPSPVVFSVLPLIPLSIP